MKEEYQQHMVMNILKIDKSNFDQKIKFGFANNLRFEENKDLPANTNLGDKISDFVGLFEYNPNENLNLIMIFL